MPSAPKRSASLPLSSTPSNPPRPRAVSLSSLSEHVYPEKPLGAACASSSSSTSTLVDSVPDPKLRTKSSSFFHHGLFVSHTHNSVDASQKQYISEYHTTRDRVSEAAINVIGDTGLIMHELLAVSADLLKLAPVVGLTEAARTLLNIWDAVQLVNTNRKGWLRLLDRCAGVLMSVRHEILAAGGETVSLELKPALDNLTIAFQNVFRMAQMQQDRSFLKRYLHRDEIEHALLGCHKQVDEALAMFNVSIQVHILRQVMHLEQRQRADTTALLQSIHYNVHLDHPQTSSTPSQLQSQSPSIPTTPLPSRITIGPLPRTADEPDADGPLARPQSTYRLARDTAELRQLMRAALQANDDTEMMRILRIGHDEVSDAITQARDV